MQIHADMSRRGVYQLGDVMVNLMIPCKQKTSGLSWFFESLFVTEWYRDVVPQKKQGRSTRLQRQLVAKVVTRAWSSQRRLLLPLPVN